LTVKGGALDSRNPREGSRCWRSISAALYQLCGGPGPPPNAPGPCRGAHYAIITSDVAWFEA